MNFAATATQLGASSATSAASGAVSDVFKRGRDQASKLVAFRSECPQSGNDPDACEGCGEPFGLLLRRHVCASCDRQLCARCLGNQLAVVFSCLCSSVCPKCSSQNQERFEFEASRDDMESGVSVTMVPPKRMGVFGGRKVATWLKLDVNTQEVCWSTLEQSRGRPADEGRIPICEVFSVRDTGIVLELAIKGQTQSTVMEFNSPSERETWNKYLRLCLAVLTTESQRTELDAARSNHRQNQVEERRALNEERKKKLSEGLGMRFTAEAMMNRGK